MQSIQKLKKDDIDFSKNGLKYDAGQAKIRSFKGIVEAKAFINNPSVSELRTMASHEEMTTAYGSACYISQVRNRSASRTFIVGDGVSLGVDQQSISAEAAGEIAKRVHEYLKTREIIRIDRQMGLHKDFKLHCRLYITKEYARIPLMWQSMLFEASNPDGEPNLVSIFVPEWPERIIFMYPETGVTYILGTDYFGEAKKSFLRMAMYLFKKKGGLGFHAGSKVLKVKGQDGQLIDVGFIMFGLSGTGKTTLTMHDHELKGEEGVAIRQDDVVMMDGSGYCFGTENGFYIKTEGLDESQHVLYNAAICPGAVLENVKIAVNGTVHFDDTELTSNGRGVIHRQDVQNTDYSIDLEKANKIIFITRRNDVVPTVAKLSPVQAAAFFMLGESIETSAGDPTRAGQSKREVGTNPFMVGPEWEEGNRLLEILQNNPNMECYLLNTGSVGATTENPGKKISIGLSTSILREIAKETIKWQKDEHWGYEVPKSIEGFDISDYNPEKYYDSDTYEKLINVLRNERQSWLAKYPGLKPEIIKVFS